MDNNQNPPSGMTGAQYHADAIEKNERGNFTEALTMIDRAMLSYKLENSKDFVVIFAVRSMIMRRMAIESNSDDFLLSAKKEVETGLEIARKGMYPAQLSTLLFQYGKVMIDLKNYQEALKLYQEAIDNIPNDPNLKKSAKADYMANLETTKLLLGDATAEQRAVAAIAAIKTSGDATDHEFYVWTAGGYLRLAEAFMSTDKTKAQAYLAEAEKLIEIDPIDLKLIKGDLDRLKSKII